MKINFILAFAVFLLLGSNTLLASEPCPSFTLFTCENKPSYKGCKLPPKWTIDEAWTGGRVLDESLPLQFVWIKSLDNGPYALCVYQTYDEKGYSHRLGIKINVDLEKTKADTRWKRNEPNYNWLDCTNQPNCQFTPL